MDHQSLPSTGTPVLVTLPRRYARPGGQARYVVGDVQERQLTLLSDERCATVPPAGLPCLVRAAGTEGRRSSMEAVIVASGASMLVIDVASDPRRHPRYRRSCRVTLEVPDGELGVVEGVLSDLSAGGLRVRCPVLLPVDQRVFVTVLFTETQPVHALAEVRGVHRGEGAGDLVVRLQFTLIAPSHRARLAALLEWPVDDPQYERRPVALATVT
jgi:hypothetical protein